MKTLQNFGKIWAYTFGGLAFLTWIISILKQEDLSMVCFLLFFMGVLGISIPQIIAKEKGDRNTGILMTAIAAAVSLILWYVMNL
jgi:hypothetical protein